MDVDNEKDYEILFSVSETLVCRMRKAKAHCSLKSINPNKMLNSGLTDFTKTWTH